MKKIGKYTLWERIGSGAYGKVYRATTSTGEEYAVKVIPKKGMSRKALKYLGSEAQILDRLSTLKNENIVKMVDKKESDHNYYMIFEYCNGLDLRQYLRERGGRLGEKSARYIIAQLINALNGLYVNGIIHRDLKLGNIFVHYPDEQSRLTDRPLIKLGDFGFAIELQNIDPTKSICDQYIVRSIVGTALTMSPEVVHQRPYSFKSDIWSLGIVLYELLTGQFCFQGESRADLIANVQHGLFEIPPGVVVSLECLEFMNMCIQYDPTHRINWKALMHHIFAGEEPCTPFDESAFHKLNQNAPKNCGNSGLMLSNKTLYTFEQTEKCSVKNKQKAKRQKKLRRLARRRDSRQKVWDAMEHVRSPPTLLKNLSNSPCSPYRKNNRR